MVTLLCSYWNRLLLFFWGSKDQLSGDVLIYTTWHYKVVKWQRLLNANLSLRHERRHCAVSIWAWLRQANHLSEKQVRLSTPFQLESILTRKRLIWEKTTNFPWCCLSPCWCWCWLKQEVVPLPLDWCAVCCGLAFTPSQKWSKVHTKYPQEPFSFSTIAVIYYIFPRLLMWLKSLCIYLIHFEV